MVYLKHDIVEIYHSGWKPSKYYGRDNNDDDYCLVGCFSMIVWTPAALSVLYACVL